MKSINIPGYIVQSNIYLNKNKNGHNQVLIDIRTSSKGGFITGGRYYAEAK